MKNYVINVSKSFELVLVQLCLNYYNLGDFPFRDSLILPFPKNVHLIYFYNL